MLRPRAGAHPQGIQDVVRNLSLCLVLLGCGGARLAGAAAESVVAPFSTWDLSDVLDHLPNADFLRLPGINPDSPYRIYVRPHLGDFQRRDYLRLPVGARVKLTERNALSAELEGYFTHGLKGTAGYGLSRLRLGAKHDRLVSKLRPIGWSVGLDFETPLSRPPRELSDGYRHTLPYFAITRELVAAWHLVGYCGIGADLISRTALPSTFGENQLHANSVTVAPGITRDWPRFRAALTVSWGSTAWLSDENQNLFILRPEVIIPLSREIGPKIRTHLLLLLGARAIWGPDGHDLGFNSGLRIEFAAKPDRTKP